MAVDSMSAYRRRHPGCGKQPSEGGRGCPLCMALHASEPQLDSTSSHIPASSGPLKSSLRKEHGLAAGFLEVLVQQKARERKTQVFLCLPVPPR